jgi:ATP-dependent DNA helicase PIF1
MLSPEQDAIFQQFVRGDNLFISGPGGCGKSFLITHMYKYLEEKFGGKGGSGVGKFQICSTTGCSAVLLSSIIGTPCVKTIHSWSGIRMGRGSIDDIVRQIVSNRHLVATWKRIGVLVVDEVSMMSAKMFLILEAVARIAKKSSRPFGGIQVVFVGDMYQLPPVPDGSGSGMDIMDDNGDIDMVADTTNIRESGQYLFEAPHFHLVFAPANCIELQHIFRQSDAKFREILNQVRIGQLDEENATMIASYVGRTYDPTQHDGLVPMKILPTRLQVATVNAQEYAKVPTKEYSYRWNVVTTYGLVAGSSSPFHRLSSKHQEFLLRDLQQSIPAEEIVQLKVGVPVMCLVNLNLDLGISNGSMGVVESFQPFVPGATDVPMVKFANGVRLKIVPHLWQHVEYPNVAIAQLPLCLSYSSTIHKLQGASLDMAEMNLGSSVFAEGQIYVGLSRVRSLDGLFLTAFQPDKIKVNDRVRAFYASLPSRRLDVNNTIEDMNADMDTTTTQETKRVFFL